MTHPITFVALCATFAVATACSAKQRPTEQASTDAALPISTKAQAEAESTHPDLVINDVHGSVKQIDYYYNEEWTDMDKSTCTFTREGAYDAIDGTPFKDYYNKGVKRDEQGRIVYLNHEAPESDDIEIIHYTYNAQGLPQTMKSESPWDNTTSTYTYNEQGELIKENVKGEDANEGPYDNSISYKILSRDDHGNWTRRQVTDASGDTWVNKRVITYWP